MTAHARVSKTGARSGRGAFSSSVFAAVARIPRGSVRTYKQIAAAAGRPGAWRAVGNILNRNHDPRIPCHRVVRSDGRTGGYNRGAAAKVRRLRREGAIKRQP